MNARVNDTVPILIVDDDTELCELLGTWLGGEGFAVEAVHDGAEGLLRALEGEFAVIVLDVMLPSLNGMDVLRKLREQSTVPVLMLSARGDQADRVVGLEIGADDYLPKPFVVRELAARLRAICRRAGWSVSSGGEGNGGGAASEQSLPASDPAPAMLQVGELRLDPGAREVWRGDDPLDLTSVEFDMLETLLLDAGRAVTRERLAERALRRELSPFDRSIDVHISNLRKKVGQQTIRTVRGVGYQFVARADDGGEES